MLLPSTLSNEETVEVKKVLGITICEHFLTVGGIRRETLQSRQQQWPGTLLAPTSHWAIGAFLAPSWGGQGPVTPSRRCSWSKKGKRGKPLSDRTRQARAHYHTTPNCCDAHSARSHRSTGQPTPVSEYSGDWNALPTSVISLPYMAFGPYYWSLTTD